MSYINHYLFIISLALSIHIANATELKERKFHSADRSKTLTAVLKDYDSYKENVTLRLKNGKIKTFSIKILSEKDQQYIIANGQALAASRQLDVKISKDPGRSRKKQNGNVVIEETPVKYNVSIKNTSKTDLEDVTFRYTMYLSNSDSTNRNKNLIHTVTGSHDIDNMYSRYNDSFSTQEIILTEKTKSAKLPSGGGGRGGGGGGGGGC